MAGKLRVKTGEAWGLVAHSLSGRLLLLTILYVMITQVLIFVPSIGREHRRLLDAHIESAQIAILPFTEPVGDQLSPALRAQLLTRAGAAAVLLPRPDQRELFLVTDMPERIDVTVDLRTSGIFDDMLHGMDCLIEGGARVLHVIAPTRIKGANAIEIIVNEDQIHSDLTNYAWRVVLFAIFLSIVTALLVFVSLYLVLVRPMRHITRAMVNFRVNPEDASRIVSPSARQDEIGIAERELASMQGDIYASLQQRARLAALGTAVAKIQHDLRNILSSAQLASDQLAKSEDPSVQRLAPRLVSSIDHAVALATNTLRYGRADENPPQRKRIGLKPVVEEACEATLSGRANIAIKDDVSGDIEIDADANLLFRILLNLLRNAADALSARGGEIWVTARRENHRTLIDVEDNGPGIASAVRERLFQPFAGSARPGGSGLGLAIARDLARAHGGDVTLVSTGETGTRFQIAIPDRQED